MQGEAFASIINYSFIFSENIRTQHSIDRLVLELTVRYIHMREVNYNCFIISEIDLA